MHTGEVSKACLYHIQLSLYSFSLFVIFLSGNPSSISKTSLSILSELSVYRKGKNFISIIYTLLADKLKILLE